MHSRFLILLLYPIFVTVLGKEIFHEGKNQAIVFPVDTYAQIGSSCRYLHAESDVRCGGASGKCEGRPGTCEQLTECPQVRSLLMNRRASYFDVSCPITKSGLRDLVCCPSDNKVGLTERVIDISSPDSSRIGRCGFPYFDYNESVRDQYPGNDSAELYMAQGFEINPIDFFVDDLFKFEISNGTYKELITIEKYEHMVFAAPGGEVARRVVAVYMALIGDGSNWHCDGVLINHQWVLTAAHCFLERDPLKETVVRLGEYNWADDSYSETEFPLDYSVVKAVLHPEYSFPSAYHDLALLKLNKARPRLRHDINPVCLPWGEEASRTHIGNEVTLTGWGATIHLGPNTPILQEVNITVFNSSVCERGYSTLRDYKDRFPQGLKKDTTLCAGDEQGGKDACQGDSGGPIVYQSEDGRYTLAGIVSTGFGCGLKEFPGIYVPINNPRYLSWIKQVAFS